MNKNELKKGEIYVYQENYINKIGKPLEQSSPKCNITNYIAIDSSKYYNKSEKGASNYTNNIRLATSEEKHWLETCIKLDKFISKEEAMKTFIPEYVEAVSDKHSSSEIIGTIYKTLELPNWVYGHKLNQYWKNYIFHYKPSTKEAYDAQFKTKEVVKVKPFEILETCRKNSNRIKQVINEEGNIFMIDDTVTTLEGVNKGKSFIIVGFRLNKAKTMICAITNAHSNGVGIDKIEHFIEKKVEKPIISNLEQWLIKTKALNLSLVELDSYINSGTNCNYYEIFNKLNGHLSKGKAKILFDEWNKEIVIEETLLEKAKRLYPVGTKFLEHTYIAQKISSGIFKVSEFFEDSVLVRKLNSSTWSYVCINNKWAEIIEYKPKVGDKFKFKKHHRGNFIIDSIKDSTDGKIIFYNQHEKYNKNHNRVLLKNITIIK